jgi:excinuclease ABC subunit A
VLQASPTQDVLDFYMQQSANTDPGIFLPYFNELPDDIAALCEIVQGLLLHDTDGSLFDYQIPRRRLEEITLTSVEKILAFALKLNVKSIFLSRAPVERVISTCREFALLLCSFLRHKKIPARLRYGFATYTYPNSNFNPDHTLVEYWSDKKNRWVLVDARTSPYHIAKKHHLISFDIYDVPSTAFMVAGYVWQKCRSGELDENNFGYGFVNRIKGLFYVRNRMLHDVASLNLQERLVKDRWGFMNLEHSFVALGSCQSILPLMDKLAFISVNVDLQLTALQMEYASVPDLNPSISQ